MRFFSLLFLFLLPLFAYAEVFDSDFVVNGDDNASATVALDLQPLLSVSSATVCTNAEVDVSTLLNTHYYLANGASSASLRSNALVSSELMPSNGVNPSTSLQWITPVTYSEIRDQITDIQVSLTPQQWSNLWDGSVPQDIIYSATYLNAPGERPPLRFPGTYDSSLHTYCDIEARLVSTNGVINLLLEDNYSGDELSTSLAFNSPQTVNLMANYNLHECLLAAVSMPTQASGRARSIDPALNEEIARTISSPAVTVTVENPFACPQLPATNIQISSPVYESSPVDASFTLSNPSAKTISINSISLGAGSAFSDLLVLSPDLPAQIAPNANIPVAITATAPAAEGNYRLNITVAYSTTTADCTGSTVSCASNITLAAEVVVETPPIEQLSCTLSPNPQEILPGGEYQFTASCMDLGGNTIACPQLSWNSSAGTMDPQVSDAPSSSTLTVTNTQGLRWVKANGTSVVGNPFQCSATLRGLSSTTCSVSPSSQVILEGETYPFTLSCFQDGDLGIPCPTPPNPSWSSNAGTMNPTNSPTGSTLTVTSEQGTYVRVQGTGEDALHFYCNSTLSEANPYACAISPPSQAILEGQNYPFTISCAEHTEGGIFEVIQCPSQLWTSNAGTMSPTHSSSGSTLGVTNASGTYVQASGAIGEFPLVCNSTLSSQTTFPNLRAELSTSDLNPALGEEFTITSKIKNTGNASTGHFINMLNHTRLNEHYSQEFEIAQLGAGTQAQNPFQFTCPTTPTIMNFILASDVDNEVAETNENDNIATISILCGPVLTCLDYI